MWSKRKGHNAFEESKEGLETEGLVDRVSQLETSTSSLLLKPPGAHPPLHAVRHWFSLYRQQNQGLLTRGLQTEQGRRRHYLEKKGF